MSDLKKHKAVAEIETRYRRGKLGKNWLGGSRSCAPHWGSKHLHAHHRGTWTIFPGNRDNVVLGMRPVNGKNDHEARRSDESGGVPMRLAVEGLSRT